MRKSRALGFAAIVASIALVTGTGNAQALGNTGWTACSTVNGAQVCWWASTHAMQICDDLADGNTPYAYIYDTGKAEYIAADSDPYGAGGCVRAYPTQSLFDDGGVIYFSALNIYSNHTAEPNYNYIAVAW
jgi:hypothetical protein